MEQNKGKPFLLKNATIYTESDKIENGYILIQDGKIQEVGPLSTLVEEMTYEVMELPAGSTLIPGLIDVHIHGVNGSDTMDATPEALMNMAEALPREGTTSFLATTITQDPEAIERALVNAGEYISSQPPTGKAEVLGVHLEGPFINKKMAGAQPLNHIISPETKLFQKWQALSKNTIKLVTLAPEVPGALDLISYLSHNEVTASLGHTDASFEEVKSAINEGATQVTHLFNQMRGLHHREPGVVGAAFLHDELKAEMIVDGIHVKPEIVDIAYQQKGSEGLLLITDSMRAKCLKNGSYDLGGQQVKVEEGKAVLEDGTLAGSILKLGQAVKNMMNYTGCSLADAIEMASVNPAKQLHVYEHKGSIRSGKDADLVVLDQNYDVFMTFCRGELAFQKERVDLNED
ncbi:N-acetylglucosamine-6-phosphate deacetylase [Mesobacillus maritimus]|uniref:N-acetylglucosamine-6-phosphate deacetylase n=1 Tax=Mesobacillus maritimus TaxID=1643336 RepID=A0ABS7K1V8_9BACI|nr:N-acetylglucosamine-6-phosphate deacetylase [Mesobacillus maritimus]MBY0096136.1 N-acetylglucosamine-6-phosphate deacetylase [Mesobacillus maritimus]